MFTFLFCCKAVDIVRVAFLFALACVGIVKFDGVVCQVNVSLARAVSRGDCTTNTLNKLNKSFINRLCAAASLPLPCSRALLLVFSQSADKLHVKNNQSNYNKITLYITNGMTTCNNDELC